MANIERDKMRRKDREITDLKEIEGILDKGFVCHLGLTDGARAYIVPLNYAYQNNAIYIHSASEGKKIDMMKANCNVCFQIDINNNDIERRGDEPCEWGTKFECIMGTGKAIFLEDPKEKCVALNLIVGRYAKRKFEFPESEVSATTVIKIEIEGITGKKADS
jgi:hypothetical protein